MREIELKPSRLLGLLLAAMVALGLTALWQATMPEGARWALALAVVGLAIRGWRQATRQARLRLSADGSLQRLGGEAGWQDVEVLGDSFVSPFLVVLRYRIGGEGVRSHVLLPDSADADDLRRLRVSLRWARRTRSDTSFPGAG